MSPLAVFRDVLTAYRREWRVLIGAGALLFGVLNLVDALLPETKLDRLNGPAVLAVLGFAGAGFVISSFEEAFYEGVVATAVSEWRAGRPRPRLLTLARLVPYVSLTAVNVVLAVGTGIGLLLLLVPGVAFGTYYALAPALVEVEHLRTRAAMRRSRELVRGHFWSVFVLLWSVYLVTVLITDLLHRLVHGFVLQYLAETTVEVVLAPFYALAAVLASYALIELRVRTPRPASEPGP